MKILKTTPDYCKVTWLKRNSHRSLSRREEESQGRKGREGGEGGTGGGSQNTDGGALFCRRILVIRATGFQPKTPVTRCIHGPSETARPTAANTVRLDKSARSRSHAGPESPGVEVMAECRAWGFAFEKTGGEKAPRGGRIPCQPLTDAKLRPCCQDADLGVR